MASFNPSTRTNETQASSQLGYSQGTGTDRSFETLFSGLGDLIGGAAKTTDNAIQNRIEKEARYGYESTNDEMNLSVDTVPSELTRTNDGLQKLATAHMQGKVTSEYYYSRLASSLKGLRARYPGYERQVDEIVQSVTGVNPANAYRNALLQNIESQQSAMASAQNKQDQWANTKENSEVLGIIAPDYWTNQEKYSTPAAQAELKSRVSQYQGRTRLAEDTVKLTNANKDVARPQLGQYLGTIASGYVVGTGEAANVDSPNVQNMITKALSDGTVDSAEKEQINGFIAMQRSQAEAHMRREFATKEWSGNFNSTEREQEIKNSLAVFDNMQELINNDQISQAAQIASRNKAQLDQKTAEVYQKYPELQTAGAIRNIAGDQAAQVLVDNLVQSVGGGQQFLKTLTPDSKIMAQDGAAAVIKGSMTIDQMADAFTEMGGKAGAEKEAMVAATLNATTSALANPGVDSETRKNTVRNTYSTKLDGIWMKVDNSTDASGMSQRSRLFNKMFSPEITKQVAALNDPESLQIYTAAAADKFQQIPEFRKAAAALSQDLPYAQYLRVEYDPERNKMIMSVNREALGNAGFFTRSDQNTINQNLQPFVTSLNQALSTMAPIIEASGVDETEGVATLLSQLNLNLNEGKQTGIFGYINGALDSAVSAASDPMGTIRSSTEDFRNNVQEFESSIGSETEGRPAGDDGSLPIDSPDVMGTIRNSTEGFRDNLQETERSLGSETQGRPAGVMNYTEESRGNAGSRAIEGQLGDSSWEELETTQVDVSPDDDISFLVGKQKLKEAASGEITGSPDDFVYKTDPLEIARSFNGLNEKTDAPTIAAFIRKSSGININPANTAWCAAFVNGVLGASGGKGTGRLNARSFLNWGQPVTNPSRGDVVVLSRGTSGWQGHVGFVIGMEEKNGKQYVRVLGGNQGNSVKESSYPVSRVLGYRRVSSNTDVAMN